MALPCNSVFQKLFSAFGSDANTGNGTQAAGQHSPGALASPVAEIIESQARSTQHKQVHESHRQALAFKGELLRTQKTPGLMANHDARDDRYLSTEDQKTKGMAQRLAHLMQHCQHALDASLDVSARVKSFQRMMAGMQSMAREGDYAGSNRRKRSLIDELWEQVDDEWGNVQLLHPLIATLPALPKKEAMIALRLIRSLLKRAPGPLKTEVCTDLAGQIEPLYAQHLNGHAEQARYLARFPGMGQRPQPDTDAPCGMAAEILVRVIKTHPRNTLSDRLFAASLDAARAQADYWLQTNHGRPRPAARKADLRAALFERGSEEQREMIDETAQGPAAGRGGGV